MPMPVNIWPSTTVDDPALRWLCDNQAAIVKAWPARPMPRTRPIKVWSDGRVRVEFVGSWKSAAHARRDCERRLAAAEQARGGEA